MLATLSRFETYNREHIASGYLKALSSVAADDELTQILTAAEDVELGGDGAEWHRYLVKRMHRSSGNDSVAKQSRTSHQYKTLPW